MYCALRALAEPTSELDGENQQNILELIFKLAKDKTIVLITHHIASIERADCIYFMQNGRLLEHGKHWDLVERRGAYFRFLQLCNAVTTQPAARARTTRMMNARSRPPPSQQDGAAPAGADVMQPINSAGASQPSQQQQRRTRSPQPQGQGQAQHQGAKPAPPAAVDGQPAQPAKAGGFKKFGGGGGMKYGNAPPPARAPNADGAPPPAAQAKQPDSARARQSKLSPPPSSRPAHTEPAADINPLWAPRANSGRDWADVSDRVRHSMESDNGDVVRFMQPLRPEEEEEEEEDELERYACARIAYLIHTHMHTHMHTYAYIYTYAHSRTGISPSISKYLLFGHPLLSPHKANFIFTTPFS